MTVPITRDDLAAQAARAGALRNGGGKPVTAEFLGRVGVNWAKAIGELLAEERLEHRKQIAALEARIAALEAKPLLEDGGVWDERALYRGGQCVTSDGSYWIAREANSGARPGRSNCWRLMVQRGRDGKDRR